MRPLTDEETRTVFGKLAQFMGRNLHQLIERTDEPHCLRLHKEHVYYVSETLMRAATNVPRKNLLSLGTCIGKFTGSKKFRLQVTCMDLLHQFAMYKVWLKASAEMGFLYGNHVLKSGLARMTDNTPQYAGVVVCSMNDMPLGFGVAAQDTTIAQTLDPTGIVVLHQADIGEYLRDEADLF